jgi:hypothetical protein
LSLYIADFIPQAIEFEIKRTDHRETERKAKEAAYDAEVQEARSSGKDVSDVVRCSPHDQREHAK